MKQTPNVITADVAFSSVVIEFSYLWSVFFKLQTIRTASWSPKIRGLFWLVSKDTCDFLSEANAVRL